MLLGLIPDNFWKQVYFKTGHGVNGKRFAQRKSVEFIIW
jgi:hypothetical protein